MESFHSLITGSITLFKRDKPIIQEAASTSTLSLHVPKPATILKCKGSTSACVRMFVCTFVAIISSNRSFLFRKTKIGVFSKMGLPATSLKSSSDSCIRLTELSSNKTWGGRGNNGSPTYVRWSMRVVCDDESDGWGVLRKTFVHV